jgi:flagellar hook-length control protein FliK
MIPFSGFMQANTFSATSFDGKPVSPANTVKGLLDVEGAAVPFDETDGSFLQWVQKLVDDDMSMVSDGERVLEPKMANHEGEASSLDVLPLTNAESEDQPSIPQHGSRMSNGDGLEDGQPWIPPAIVDALRAQHEGGAAEDAPGHQPLSDLPTMDVPKKGVHAVGHSLSADDALSNPTTTNGNTIQNENGALQPVKEKSFVIDGKDEMLIEGGGKPDTPIETGGMTKKPIEMTAKQNPSMERGDQKDPPSLFKPVVTASETEKTGTIQTEQQGPPSGLGILEKAIDPTPAHGQSIAGSTKKPESVTSMQTGEEMDSSGDDAARFQDGGKRGQTRRMAFAEAKEAELHKDQSLNSMKSFAGEPIKPDPSFQDTAKAMTAEPLATVAEKSTPGQATALARPETPAAGTFQSTVMDQIVEKASLRSIHGRSEVRIRLKPEFLGNVQMNIATDKEQVVVRITTDQPVVKDIIESHLHHLKAELQNQGLTIDKFDVVVNPDADQHHNREPFSQMFKHHSSNDGRRQAQDQNPEKRDPKGGNDDTDKNDDRPSRDGVNYFA